MYLQATINIEQELALNFEGPILSITNKGATSFHTRMKTEEGTNKINTLWLVSFLRCYALSIYRILSIAIDKYSESLLRETRNSTFT
jgi:hypothetical protein